MRGSASNASAWVFRRALRVARSRSYSWVPNGGYHVVTTAPAAGR